MRAAPGDHAGDTLPLRRPAAALMVRTSDRQREALRQDSPGMVVAKNGKRSNGEGKPVERQAIPGVGLAFRKAAPDFAAA